MGGHIQRAVRALSFDDMSISWRRKRERGNCEDAGGGRGGAMGGRLQGLRMEEGLRGGARRERMKRGERGERENKHGRERTEGETRTDNDDGAFDSVHGRLCQPTLLTDLHGRAAMGGRSQKTAITQVFVGGV